MITLEQATNVLEHRDTYAPFSLLVQEAKLVVSLELVKQYQAEIQKRGLDGFQGDFYKWCGKMLGL